MKLDKDTLRMLSDAAVSHVKWDSDGNVLELQMGRPMGPMEELAALTPEQLKAEAEKLLFAATEGFGG